MKKCQAISFGKPIPLIPAYTFGSTTLDWINRIKYLGVNIQSDVKFDTHIEERGTKSKKTCWGIKHLMYMYNAPKGAKLLAYTSLCRPILEYVDVVWDPHTKTNINKVEMIQKSSNKNHQQPKKMSRQCLCRQGTVRPGLTWREKESPSLLTKVLQNKDEHNPLAAAYDEINQNKKQINP